MAKNLVNGTNVVIEESGDNINMNLSSTYSTNLQQEINDSFKKNNIYSTTETVVGTWMGKPLYRKVIIENVSNGSSVSDISNLNIKELYYYASVCYRKGQDNNDYETPYYSGQNDYFRIFFRTNNISSDYPTSIQYRIASTYSSFKITTTIYYTKTTD